MHLINGIQGIQESIETDSLCEEDFFEDNIEENKESLQDLQIINDSFLKHNELLISSKTAKNSSRNMKSVILQTEKYEEYNNKNENSFKSIIKKLNFKKDKYNNPEEGKKIRFISRCYRKEIAKIDPALFNAHHKRVKTTLLI